MRLAAIRGFVISAILITTSVTTTFADSPNELTEASPATVTGYYHSDDYDIIILPNGTYLCVNNWDFYNPGMTRRYNTVKRDYNCVAGYAGFQKGLDGN